MITILGPTASGKTSLAASLAAKIDGEIISADSRQVYRGMSIGTGKDLDEFVMDGQQIPYHLIDIHPAGYDYNVFEYQRDFHHVYADIINRKKSPILCGGSGMYLDAVLKGYKLVPVPHNENLRAELSQLPHEELIKHLKSLQPLHNTTDTKTIKRTIRAIEITTYFNNHGITDLSLPKIDHKIFGMAWNRSVLKKRIKQRLDQRLDQGMIEEVEQLIQEGVSIEKLKYYGLEYKFIALHLFGELQYQEMVDQLNIAIRQYAKKQMTWFRRMEKQGFEIHWLDGQLNTEENVNIMIKSLDGFVF